MPSPSFQPPPGFRATRDGAALLVVREECAEPVRRALSPLYQAWTRISQRRFTAVGRAGIVQIKLGGGLEPMIVRRYMHGGLFGAVGRDLFFGPERALAELLVSEAARSGGVRTPTALGFLGEKVRGPLWRLAFLSREVADSEDMIHYCCRLTEYPDETAAFEKRGVIGDAARQIRVMHDLGIYHSDLHLKNLLMRRRQDGAAEVYVIDFDKARRGEPLGLEARLRNLKRLARSVRKVRVADAALTAWDRLRFLRAYLKGRPQARELMRRWAGSLATSGAGREIWWTVSGAKRNLRGDKLALAAQIKE